MSTVIREEKMSEKKIEQNTANPDTYGCEIILEKTTFQKVNDPLFPSDAKLIWYEVEGELYIDLCRGGNVKIFDMYYDRYGPGAVKKIDFGYGRTNPRLWRYKSRDKRKRK